MQQNMRLVQLRHPLSGRHVAVVQEPNLLLLSNTASVYQLASEAIKLKKNIVLLAEERLTGISLDYNAVYPGSSDWKLLPSFDHPSNHFACLVSGTGLTHKNSALNRQVMHQAGQENLTDSMKMYQWGLEGGQPAAGSAGVQPEWFYKGTGEIIKGHGDILEVPSFAGDGGEEPEVAGIYIVDENAEPYRIGFTTGNEFSDHVMEKKNYLYLAPSKLRQCAIGPELLVSEDFANIEGTVSISRQKNSIWQQDIKTGEKNMAHSLVNLEYHHFKYASHRQPLQAHIHFFGADAFSFGKGIVLENGDLMQVYWKGLGRPLQNILSIVPMEEKWTAVKTIV